MALPARRLADHLPMDVAQETLVGASVAAVLIIRKEREVVELFRRAGATDPNRACSLDELQVDDSMTVKRLKTRAVLREASPGRYYLDEPSWVALRGIRRRVAIMIIVAILLVLFVALTARRAH